MPFFTPTEASTIERRVVGTRTKGTPEGAKGGKGRGEGGVKGGLVEVQRFKMNVGSSEWLISSRLTLLGVISLRPIAVLKVHIS